MATDKPDPKPTKAETASNLLRLGHLLHQYAYPQGDLGLTRPLKPDEAERLKSEIEAMERRIEEAVCDSRQWLLRGLLGVRGQECADSLTVRIVAYVAWANLASDRPEVSVSKVANAVAMGDVAAHLEARRTIRLMLVRGTAIGIRDSEFSIPQLLAGDRLVGFLSGQGNLAVVFSSKSIEEEKAEWRRGILALLKHCGMARVEVTREAARAFWRERKAAGEPEVAAWEMSSVTDL